MVVEIYKSQKQIMIIIKFHKDLWNRLLDKYQVFEDYIEFRQNYKSLTDVSVYDNIKTMNLIFYKKTDKKELDKALEYMNDYLERSKTK